MDEKRRKFLQNLLTVKVKSLPPELRKKVRRATLEQWNEEDPEAVAAEHERMEQLKRERRRK